MKSHSFNGSISHFFRVECPVPIHHLQQLSVRRFQAQSQKAPLHVRPELRGRAGRGGLQAAELVGLQELGQPGCHVKMVLDGAFHAGDGLLGVAGIMNND